MKEFEKSTLIEIYEACKGHNIFHQDTGAGIILRHDVDDCMEKSYRCSKIQDDIGVKATYFILDTKPYFKNPETFAMLREMQSNGHEIGWHNDALLTHYIKGADLRKEIERPLKKLRDEGLNIKGTVAHGNRIKYGFVNHQVWKGIDKNNLYQTVPWTKNIRVPIEGVGNEQFYLSEFGLEYDGMVTIDYDIYKNDNSKIWFGDIVSIIRKIIAERKRMIFMLHPQHWNI